MDIEQLEQVAAVIVTAGLVAGNFLMFTPWRDGVDPRQRQPESVIPQNESVSFHIARGGIPRETGIPELRETTQQTPPPYEGDAAGSPMPTA